MCGKLTSLQWRKVRPMVNDALQGTLGRVLFEPFGCIWRLSAIGNGVMRAIAAAALCALAACSSPVESAAKEAVKAQLVDPESARFRNVVTQAKTGAVCGEMNAKNRMGGYVGFTEFYVIDGKAHLPEAPEILLDGSDELRAATAKVRFSVDRMKACSGI